jgi:hypothetical protein
MESESTGYRYITTIACGKAAHFSLDTVENPGAECARHGGRASDAQASTAISTEFSTGREAPT